MMSKKKKKRIVDEGIEKDIGELTELSYELRGQGEVIDNEKERK